MGTISRHNSWRKALYVAPRRRFIIVVILCTIIVVSASVLAIWVNLHTSSTSFTTDGSVITHSTAAPSETAPDTSYTWHGDATDPKKITIPAVKIDGYLQKVGVDQNNQMAVPDNTHMAGWFVNSVKPGEKGLGIIDGHVDGRTKNAAIFGSLEKLNNGDIVEVESGNGTIRRFEVVRLVNVTLAEAATTLYSQDPSIKQQLNLITCVGTYSDSTKTYDHRLIVVTRLVI